MGLPAMRAKIVERAWVRVARAAGVGRPSRPAAVAGPHHRPERRSAGPSQVLVTAQARATTHSFDRASVFFRPPEPRRSQGKALHRGVSTFVKACA